MPSITDLKNIKKTNKIFEKKEYRPWNEKGDVPMLKNETSKSNKELNVDSLNSIELEKIWRGLYGAKKTLLNIILQNIEETHDSYVITKTITNSQLITNSSLPSNTIKSAIQQLKNSYLISNYETKPGKGGFARYQVPKNVYEYFVEKYSSNT
jgi:hypothetical protein